MGFAKVGLGLALLSWSGGSYAAQVLKPQDVIDAVLSKSLEAERISLDSQDAYIGVERALGNFDFKLNAKTGYEYRESETMTGLSNPIDKTLTANLELEKATWFGSVFTLGYEHTAQSSVLNPVVSMAGTRGSTQAMDSGYVQWRHRLWANSFGLGDRRRFAQRSRASE
ncbi:MAG: hypothetical protein HC902_09165 [Calothrix sp. SM1_5_4]|nr:hypothetical protein [Calothrix sp. SM1_5_4]